MRHVLRVIVVHFALLLSATASAQATDAASAGANRGAAAALEDRDIYYDDDGLIAHGSAAALMLDDDVQLTHYRLQKLGERQLDLESGDVAPLKSVSEAGTGIAVDDEKKKLSEIVAKMNDLFPGEISEADFLGVVTTWKGHLLADETLAEQAKANTEEQFAMGSFKYAFMDVVIDAQDAQNNITDQMLKDPRIFGVVQGMLAKMLYAQFQQSKPT